MKERIFNNFSLKILSAICAIILWAIIVNIYDPNTGVTISGVTVQMLNEESLTDKGYSYDVLDGSKISVYISGPKSVITDIKASDIVATADLSKVSAFADYVDIDVKVVKDGQQLSNITVTPKTTAVKLDIENRVSQNFDITSNVIGSVADGYTLSNVTISPTTVKITGSASAIAKIAQVKAVYDVSGATEDISGNASVMMYDSEGNTLSDSSVELSRSEVAFSATVKQSKTVPIQFDTSGTPASGYFVQQVTASATEATITGEKSTLDTISQITIPATALNVDGLTADKTFRIWLTDYASAGVSILSDNMITISVIISDGVSKSISFSASDITIRDIPAGYQAQLADNVVNASFQGMQSLMDSFSKTSVKAYVSLAGMQAGTYPVTLQFELPTGVKAANTYTTTVTLTEEQQTTEQTTAEQQQTTAAH